MQTRTLTIQDSTDPDASLRVQSQPGEPPAYSEVLYRLFLPVGGPVDVVIEGCGITLDQFQLLTLSPGERISFSPSASFLSCAFHHNFFCVRVMRNEVFCDGVVFNRLRGLPIVDLKEDGYRTARARFEELGNIISGESLFKPEHAINTIKSLLLQAADCKIRYANPDETFQVTPAKVSEIVARFQDLVEDNYAKHLEIAEYCDMLGVTIATLNRHVKNELGQTAKQLAQERLALEARVALRTGDRSVKEVAFDLGFGDPLYFSRFFRKQFGAAPTQYFSGTA
ncbi:helix-turn-helix domain-containing protein [Actibacterium sp. 188UL27-1]|uniref:helix-turn-helix domain-containing protein n=1 Tax=Actibacterium sp. 188UL27-1 TaxID=2786961 RepID=UPI00195EC3F3|nr:helix-turn-helix domain-containing protein [Actibacterium sp. 188UL27-1]MBM7067004.1 helix-turn-helix domain-containing protein [Actibacterium sp. 188UL27-1]